MKTSLREMDSLTPVRMVVVKKSIAGESVRQAENLLLAGGMRADLKMSRQGKANLVILTDNCPALRK